MAKRFGPYKYEFELSKRNYSFETHIDQIVANTKEKMLDVTKEALSRTIEEMQVPTSKGGKMRVDTGFLRNSAVAEINALPSGVSTGRKRKKGEIGILSEYEDDNMGPTGVKIGDLEIGDTFYFGWTANYARIREAYDGFMESALMNWQKHVDDAVRMLK